MAQQAGLSPTPLLEEGLIAATGPNNTWALTELGLDVLNGEYVSDQARMEQDWTNESLAKHSAPDMVNEPPHYTQGGIECIDAIRAALTPEEFRGFCKGNAIKYSWREKLKGGDEDLKKAAWYLAKVTA
jgi:hypothetical protein